MMEKRSWMPPASTFVIRFWRERTATGVRWRGRIEHVQTGNSNDFLELEEIVDFMYNLGIMPKEHNVQPPEELIAVNTE